MNLDTQVGRRLSAACESLDEALRRGGPGRRAALDAVAGLAGPWMGEHTLHTARRAIETGDWLPSADDAWRTLRSQPGPWVVIVPISDSFGCRPHVLWSSPSPGGTQVVLDAPRLRNAMTRSLFGYRTSAALPSMKARMVHHGPGVLAAADDVGRLQVRSPAFASAPPTWALLTSAEGEIRPGRMPGGSDQQLVKWATAASALAAEGPLHARRVSVRQAPAGPRRRAAALIGLCGSWLFLHRTDPSFEIGPHKLHRPALPKGEPDSHRSAAQNVLRLWRHADSVRTTASAVDTVLGLLSEAMPLLMRPGPSGFTDFDHWFQERLSATYAS
ncbi:MULTISPECIES: hypothetical protein [unclassified Streptomyces]|uniref:hypothetical protein n=1 Tax=unclassified Streptomyces TaxID=2593676 RepID=UPI0004CC57A9|nr:MULTISPECIES: hypothetical protein [unclassified Streptomyces]KJY22190.1 hypothetical protein VR43_07415 [Streptomyces sp. NRRL S-104]